MTCPCKTKCDAEGCGLRSDTDAMVIICHVCGPGQWMAMRNTAYMVVNNVSRGR